MKNGIGFIGLIGVVSSFGFVFARDFNAFGRMHFFGGFFVWLMPLLFLSSLVLTIVALFQWFRTRHDPLHPYKTTEVTSGDSALEILRQRLAKGEIDPEDYEARRKVLLNKD